MAETPVTKEDLAQHANRIHNSILIAMIGFFAGIIILMINTTLTTGESEKKILAQIKKSSTLYTEGK